MEEYKILKILDRFKGIYLKLGVDYEKMRLIIKLKLNLDRRKTSTIMRNSKDQKDSGFTYTLFLYGLMGLFIGLTTFGTSNKMLLFSMIFGMFMFFILTIFISDFSNVLLDVRDKNVIGTKGIDNRTINAAKVTHICYYIFLITLSLAWLSIIGMFRFGILTGILFIIELIVTDIFMIVITALIYLLILRFFDGEKVKDIINYVQIVLTIVMTLGYQVIGRMFDFTDVQVIYESSIWNLLLPPMWFASPLYAINGGEINNIVIILILLAVIIPILAIAIYIKNTSKFENLLSKLNIAKSVEKEKNKGIFYKFGRLICNNNEERAAYDLSVCTIRREREFKSTIYPSLAITMVFPILFPFMYSRVGIGSMRDNLSLSLNIYWFVLNIPNLLICLQHSSSYKGSWIYKAAFIDNQSNIYKGAYKGLIVNMLLPLYLIESVVFIEIYGLQVVQVLITTFVFMLNYVVIIHLLEKNKLPFSVKSKIGGNNEGLGTMLLGILIIIIAAAINFVLLKHKYLLTIYGLILLLTALILWKKCIKSYN